MVLIGKGAAALRRGRLADGHASRWPAPGVAGALYPTAETLAAQVVMLVIVVAGFGFNMLSARRPIPAKA